VVSEPGSEAESQPKLDVRSFCRTKPSEWLRRALGQGSDFGAWFPRTPVPGSECRSCVALARGDLPHQSPLWILNFRTSGLESLDPQLTAIQRRSTPHFANRYTICTSQIDTPYASLRKLIHCTICAGVRTLIKQIFFIP
jgi:hypothetical protein